MRLSNGPPTGEQLLFAPAGFTARDFSSASVIHNIEKTSTNQDDTCTAATGLGDRHVDLPFTAYMYKSRVFFHHPHLKKTARTCKQL